MTSNWFQCQLQLFMTKDVFSWDNTSDRKLECYNVDKLNATHVPILVDYKTNKKLGIVNNEMTVINCKSLGAKFQDGACLTSHLLRSCCCCEVTGQDFHS
jgi:hypothetical protein